MLEREKSGYLVQLTTVAQLYARLGEKEQTLAWLQKAVEERNFYILALKVEPAWDTYRADPRFVALMRRVRLTP